ncbi:hypothetical protein B0181_01185 [Moraxella caviae]|uniref:Uncharacterized protein n=1 Tax=Moraxella caviae TaxID=34060 RepID=A0A1T0AAM4_9GAMM|nr:hypothetical protein [Moraxella caviae]OOR92777.1 hypothetical protein B0181_01185 [Moraxella caviae]STZ14186.1 Uncharacterised protein [Moraxella caviae]VEW12632.1 Uncharacterised protein [Moraxella caviae]
MDLKRDISKNVLEFAQKRDVLHHRYLSFDFCYHYFYNINTSTQDREKSCYVLWSYLASWGMLRGSSFLL